MPIPDMPLQYQLILEAFWLVPALLAAYQLSGRSRAWVGTRRAVRGWFPWFLLIVAVGVGMLVNAEWVYRGLAALHAPEIVGQVYAFVTLFLPLPLAFLALLVGVPRAIQPRWIKERLAAEDALTDPDEMRPNAKRRAELSAEWEAQREQVTQQVFAEQHAAHQALSDERRRQADEARGARRARLLRKPSA